MKEIKLHIDGTRRMRGLYKGKRKDNGETKDAAERGNVARHGFTKVYICSPYRGDTEKNVAAAVKYCRYAIGKGMVPIAPHIYLTRFLNDDIPEQRELGLRIGLEALAQCAEIWVFGNYVSEGMKREIAAASEAGKRILFKDIYTEAAE